MSRYKKRFGDPSAGAAAAAAAMTAAQTKAAGAGGLPTEVVDDSFTKLRIADIWPTRETLEDLMNESEAYPDGCGSCG
jgi:hypothetical protein